MEILENRAAWEAAYRAGWLAHFERTGETDFRQYVRPKNSIAPSGPGMDLSRSRLLLISSAGGYLPDQQEPFDAPHPLGDYSILASPPTRRSRPWPSPTTITTTRQLTPIRRC